MSITLTDPISSIACILGRKWTLELPFQLRQHRHFCALREAVGHLKPSTLTQRLRQLDRDRLVNRMKASTAPVHIGYTLTERGPLLDALVERQLHWAPEAADEF